MKSTDPLSIEKLKERTFEKPKELEQQFEEVNVSSFTLPKGAEPRLKRNWEHPGSYNVVVELESKHIEYEKEQLIKPTPVPRIPVTPLGKDCLRQFGDVESIIGKKRASAPGRFFPEKSKIDLELAEEFKRRSKGEDRPTNIFGTDERYIYQDTSFPWRTVGRVWTETGACTGCTIGPRLVLTASHCINWKSGGGAGWVKFSPSYYNGNGPWGEFYATRVIYWNKAQGGLSDLETAFDYVVLVMNDYIGNRVGYPGYRTYSESWDDLGVWQHMGYPGDLTSTQRPAYEGSCSISSVSPESTSGQEGFVLGHFNDVTGGHSGGPVWGWWDGESWPRVVGVQSAESNNPAFNTSGDNEFGGGPGLSALISWARNNYP